MNKRIAVWLISVFGWIFGGLWLLTIYSTPKQMPEASGKEQTAITTSVVDPYLELDSVIEVDAINSGSLEPWLRSSL